jgi:hypothetical protein
MYFTVILPIYLKEGKKMRVLALTLSVLLFFPNSLSAVPQGHKEKIQLKKWVAVPVDGIPYTVKVLLTADEKCGDIRKPNARIQCYQDFNILLQEAEPIGDDEVELPLGQGQLIRTTEEAFCAAREIGKKSRPILLGPCHAAWEELLRQQNGPEWFCKKVKISPAKKEERCQA